MTYKIQSKKELETFATENWDAINTYITEQRQGLPIPFYTSVDIRESLDRYAPVDNNLYPAGFNNICLLDQNICIDRIKKEILTTNEKAQKIGILSESHTKNLFYLDHLATLKSIIERAGFECFIISVDSDLMGENSQLELTSQSGFDLTLFRAEINEQKFYVKDTELDFVVLNNDQSNPLNIEWSTLKTPIQPPAQMGWFYRKKTSHFEHYHRVCTEFCEKFSINPYLLQARFKIVNDVDFLAKEGLEKLASEVGELQKEMSQKKVFIKANQGTYGMGIMTVDSPEEALSMNRKIRNKMDVGKNRKKFTSVIVQEGIETALTHDGNPAEIAIYLIGGRSVGGFLRTNPLKDSESNLNSRGMVYQKFCISEIHQGHDHKAKEAVYSIIAQISTIASSYEIKDALNT